MEEDKIEIKYEIYKKFLKPTKKHNQIFDELNFCQKDMQTTFNFSDIDNQFEKDINLFMKNLDLKVTRIWAQKYENAQHEAHTHLPAEYSFVWYIEVDRDCSEIVFYNPGWPYFETHKIKVKPFTGLFLLFPGFLPHEVLYNTKCKRNIISGNLTWQK